MSQKPVSPQKPAPLVVFPKELLSIPTTNTTAEPGSANKPPLLTGITQDRVYSFFGLFDDEAGTATPHSLAASAAVSIASNSDGNPDRLAEVIHRFLKSAQQDCMAEAAPQDQLRITQACWLVVRMFKPSKEYEVPRWHRDGRMFPCSCSTVKTQEQEEDRRLPHSKYAVTLLGPPTRVLKPHEAVDAALNRVWENRGPGYDEARERAELAEASRGCEEYEVRRGQVIRFSWGQSDSPVHSEPDFGGEDRIFVSVLFGSEEEIREMCKWRQETFGEVKVRG